MKVVLNCSYFLLICAFLVNAQSNPNHGDKLAELLSKKKKAVEVEDYDEAQRIKLLIGDLNEIEQLTIKKERAVEEEDYLTAKKLQTAIKRLENNGGVLNQLFDFGPRKEETVKTDSKVEFDDNFVSAFVASFSMIMVSELGDKTFFIAAIMAMRHNRLTIFSAAILALAVMTVLSTVAGYALPSVLPREYTHFVASLLFVFFGFKLLIETWSMDPEAENEEMEEVENELKGSKADAEANNMEKGFKHRGNGNCLQLIFSQAFIQCFTMTFLAEWGDRSQIATIALAAAKDPIGVTLGGVIGHSICTGLAVIGGKLLATRISERALAFCGGILFLIFAVHSFYVGPDSNS